MTDTQVNDADREPVSLIAEKGAYEAVFSLQEQLSQSNAEIERLRGLLQRVRFYVSGNSPRQQKVRSEINSLTSQESQDD